MSVITQRGNLAEIVVAKLVDRIDSGLYAPGEKIPSSAQLCEEFGVSRTVIREALTSLKVAGRVIARQGAAERPWPRLIEDMQRALLSLAPKPDTPRTRQP